MQKDNDFDMPVICDCGNVFDLNNGYTSLKDNSKTVCPECFEKQSEDQEREDEIEVLKETILNSESEIESLQEDISTEKERILKAIAKLKELGVEYP